MKNLLRLLPLLALAIPLTARAGSKSSDTFTDGQKSFEAAMKSLMENYVDADLTEADLWRGATQGMLEHAGERSWDTLLSPSEMEDMKSNMAGEVVGIGVEIKFDPDTGMTQVKGIIPGSGAEKAGIQVGDQILKIDGRNYKGQELKDVIAAIRGKPGVEVSLTLLRDDKVLVKSVKREKIPIPTVTDAILPGEIGVLTIASFNEKTPELVKAALDRFAARHVRGVVVDVRNDAGGLFDKLIEVANLLMPAGRTIVTEVKRGGEETPFVAKGGPALPTLPMVVITNEKTASSAEILAGALQSTGAKVVGRKTFGKWNVQTVDELPNRYAMKFTVGYFKSPKGDLLDAKGLMPDMEVEMETGLVDSARRLDGRERIAADAQLRVAVESLRL